MQSVETSAVPASVSAPTKMASIAAFLGNKQFAAGVVLGLSLLAGGYAISASGVGGTGGGSSDPSSTLLSNQESAITAQMRLDAQECAKGDKQGTVGNAINMSLKAHLELASASPNVEQLFDVNSDCFSGLSSLIDLSFAIPSLASILAAAQQAVLNYAKKKICSAVSRVTGMVTGPINQALGQANGYIGALNGMSAGLNNGGGLSMIDPALGSAYNIGQTGTYTTGQPAGGTGTGNTPVGNSGAGNTNYTQVQVLTQQLGTMQASLGPAQQAVDQARQNLAQCQQNSESGGGSCASAEAGLQAALANVTNIQNQITSLQNQINALLGQGGSGGGATPVFGGTSGTGSSSSGSNSNGVTPGDGSGSTIVFLPQSAAAPAQEQTLMQKMSSLFK